MRFSSHFFAVSARPVACCALLLCTGPAFASHFHHGPTAGQHKSKHKTLHGASHTAGVSSRPRAMDDARATEIQTSLVKAGYLPSVSGHWDEASADAMRKLQGDNGWQTKLIPDSRALIKLGLGPTSSTLPASAPTGTTPVNPTGTTSGKTYPAAPGPEVSGSRAELARPQ